jgi:hypothetical protein
MAHKDAVLSLTSNCRYLLSINPFEPFIPGRFIRAAVKDKEITLRRDGKPITVSWNLSAAFPHQGFKGFPLPEQLYFDDIPDPRVFHGQIHTPPASGVFVSN